MPFADDVKKRLMLVPHCRVIRLVTDVQGGIGRVTEVQTTLGNVPVANNTKGRNALGTIESARLALISFQGISNYDQIGQNLMAHFSVFKSDHPHTPNIDKRFGSISQSASSLGAFC